MAYKLIVAKMPICDRECIATVLYDGSEAIELCIDEVGAESVVNNIYLGRVEKVINSGFFVRYDGVNEGFLSANKAKGAIFKTVKKDQEIKAGDELLVMADAEPIKTKLTGLTAELSISGETIVVCSGFCGIRYSSKLNAEQKKYISDIFDGHNFKYGLIIRTSAIQKQIDELISEAEKLCEKMESIIKYGTARLQGACLYKAGGVWLEKLKRCGVNSVEKIVTDVSEVYAELSSYLENEAGECSEADKCSLYNDNAVALYRLYNLSALLERATSEKVFLGSGAYLVIQQTEAFVCIDVNSGKAKSKKNDDGEFLRINLEAACEAARQIRLRQLSGTILIDFINMNDPAQKSELIRAFSNYTKSDPAEVRIVDITPLGIMEITRRKKHKSLNEQLISLKG